MISLVVCRSRLWVVTIVFYTCILIPSMQLKRALVSMFGRLMIFFSYETKGMAKEMEFPEIPSLPVARYEDLRGHSCVGGEDGERDEICSICLVEYEGEDAVSELGRCGHVFHLNCIEQWIHRNQFSCPLCRSFLFSQHCVHTQN
ncbi:RING-H2 finger protein ATL18 [Spatholobus suberectus]|nr:RING-H2 finger protein ATL18 [Spatholobus suberectus]